MTHIVVAVFFFLSFFFMCFGIDMMDGHWELDMMMRLQEGGGRLLLR